MVRKILQTLFLNTNEQNAKTKYRNWFVLGRAHTNEHLLCTGYHPKHFTSIISFQPHLNPSFQTQTLRHKVAKERAQSDTVNDGASFQVQAWVPNTLTAAQIVK